MPNTVKSAKGKSTNRLLTALPDKDFQNLLGNSERIELVYGTTIYKTGAVIRDVYFPESGIVSLLSAVGGDQTLEVGIVGNEGMIGVPAFLGAKTSNNIALVQGAGFALRMSTADFLAECETSNKLQQVVKRFVQSLIAQTAQSSSIASSQGADDALAYDDKRPNEIWHISDLTGILIEHGRCPTRSGQYYCEGFSRTRPYQPQPG